MRELEKVATIKRTYELLKEAGYDVTLRMVQRMAGERRLPFARGPDNKTLYIRMSDLQAALEKGFKPAPRRTFPVRPKPKNPN